MQNSIFYLWLYQAMINYCNKCTTTAEIKNKTINCNNCQLEPTLKTQNWYLSYLIDPSFQRVNNFFYLIIWKGWISKKLQAMFCSNCRNKVIQFYDWWKKMFWSAIKKWSNNVWKHLEDRHWSNRIFHNWLFANYFKNYYNRIAKD